MSNLGNSQYHEVISKLVGALRRARTLVEDAPLYDEESGTPTYERVVRDEIDEALSAAERFDY